jgi:putative membrane protein
MTRTIVIGMIVLGLATTPAWAADAKAEIDFVSRASIGNLIAIAASRLALDRTSDSRVKAFARQLIEDHGNAEAALEAAADGSGATVPTTLDQDYQARLTALQGKSGADFDKTYVADQAEVHSNALSLYADYMLLGDNSKLKALAIKMVPIAEAQFKGAQTLAGE